MELYRATPAEGPSHTYTADSIVRGVSMKDIIQIAKLEVGEEYLGADDVVWERIA